MTDEELYKKVHEIIYKNMCDGTLDNGMPYHFTKPSPGTYPFQFFWDTCFHVYIFTALGDHEMAKQHLQSLFSRQQDDGFVGHMIYWDTLRPGRITDIFQSKPTLKNLYKSHMTALIQPPLAAQATMRIYEASGDKGFLQEMVPKLKKYYDWIAKNRDFDGDGLITIITPYESGMDWKPTYDVALGMEPAKAGKKLFLKVTGVDFWNFIHNYNYKKIREKGKFLVKDAGFNTIYAQNLKALSLLCNELNDDESSKHYMDLSHKVANSICKVMYDDTDAAFYDVYGHDNKKIKVLTPTIFYPLILNEIDETIEQKVLKTHFFDYNEFNATYPIPSVAKNNASFNPDESLYLWRGPVWIINNWFMHRLLLKKGYPEEAQKLIDSIRQLIDKSGFREYYNPFTGEGHGAKEFTWAGLIIDMLEVQKQETVENTKV
ncbi:amylo-alpha-1,6-glucosidase [Flavobacterium rhizosphaerae]|uniref:Trehalase family glycosidase n=1 Tax=Flavobacterium rhizosphaerae TaxID=3163298 RepID=A0ABW8YYG1_9FLAO